MTPYKTEKICKLDSAASVKTKTPHALYHYIALPFKKRVKVFKVRPQNTTHKLRSIFGQYGNCFSSYKSIYTIFIYNKHYMLWFMTKLQGGECPTYFKNSHNILYY